jgi:hypothetical protein
MTIGELHAGHCIDPSLADVVSERNGIRCMESLCTRNWQARQQPNRMKKTTLTRSSFGMHPAYRQGTDRVVGPLVAASDDPASTSQTGCSRGSSQLPLRPEIQPRNLRPLRVRREPVLPTAPTSCPTSTRHDVLALRLASGVRDARRPRQQSEGLLLLRRLRWLHLPADEYDGIEC